MQDTFACARDDRVYCIQGLWLELGLGFGLGLQLRVKNPYVEIYAKRSKYYRRLLKIKICFNTVYFQSMAHIIRGVKCQNRIGH